MRQFDPDWIEGLKFDSTGLIPAVVQDVFTGQVLMLAYMNKESLKKTLETGRSWFFSRSRQELWQKGETSGNYQEVWDVSFDCDADALLVRVAQKGCACHIGTYSCFSNRAAQMEDTVPAGQVHIVNDLYQLLCQRGLERPENSYTAYLFNEGRDKILKKVGEETAEVIIASKNDDAGEIIYELADLFYHCLVLLVHHGINPGQVLGELEKRRRE